MKHDAKIFLLPLIAELQKRTGKRLDDAAYAKRIGISRQAFKVLMDGETTSVANATINKLLDFFAAEGMPVGVGDLFTVVVTNDQPPSA